MPVAGSFANRVAHAVSSHILQPPKNGKCLVALRGTTKDAERADKARSKHSTHSGHLAPAFGAYLWPPMCPQAEAFLECAPVFCRFTAKVGQKMLANFGVLEKKFKIVIFFHVLTQAPCSWSPINFLCRRTSPDIYTYSESPFNCAPNPSLVHIRCPKKKSKNLRNTFHPRTDNVCRFSHILQPPKNGELCFPPPQRQRLPFQPYPAATQKRWTACRPLQALNT